MERELVERGAAVLCGEGGSNGRLEEQHTAIRGGAADQPDHEPRRGRHVARSGRHAGEQLLVEEVARLGKGHDEVAPVLDLPEAHVTADERREDEADAIGVVLERTCLARIEAAEHWQRLREEVRLVPPRLVLCAWARGECVSWGIAQ